MENNNITHDDPIADAPDPIPPTSLANNAEAPQSLLYNYDADRPAEAAVQVQGTPQKLPMALYIAGLLYALVLLATISTFATNSYDFANSMSALTFYGGVAAAIATGVGIATMMHRSGGMGKNGMVRAGMILLILSVVGGVLTLVPGIICLIVGSKKPVMANPKPMSQGAKIALAIGGFLAGFIPGVIIALILGFITSERACELSSSKCY